MAESFYLRQYLLNKILMVEANKHTVKISSWNGKGKTCILW